MKGGTRCGRGDADAVDQVYKRADRGGNTARPQLPCGAIGRMEGKARPGRSRSSVIMAARDLEAEAGN